MMDMSDISVKTHVEGLVGTNGWKSHGRGFMSALGKHGADRVEGIRAVPCAWDEEEDGRSFDRHD